MINDRKRSTKMHLVEWPIHFPDLDVVSVRPDITVMVNDVNVEETFVILDRVIPKLNVLLLIIHHFLGNWTSIN